MGMFCAFCLAPTAPTIIPEECSAENNSVTVAWQPPPQSHVEGYVLELDDGNGGEFRVSHRETFRQPMITYCLFCIHNNTNIVYSNGHFSVYSVISPSRNRICFLLPACICIMYAILNN